MDRVGVIPYDYIKIFRQTRKARHLAQYDVTASVIKNEAEDSFEKAAEFVENMRIIYKKLKEIKNSLE